jgi:glycosyltransferase involved in cell wall biosynthesis
MSDNGRIRVVHIIDHLGLGGAQTFLFDLVLEQHRSGSVRPAVCCLTEVTSLSHQFTHRDVPLYHLNVARRNPFEIATIPGRLLLLVRKRGYDLVHTHLFVSGVFGRLAAMMAGVPAVIQEQCNETEVAGVWRRWIDRVLGNRTAGVICVSKSTKEFNVQAKRIDPARIWVVPNGIDPQRFAVDASKRLRRRLLGLFELPSVDQIVIGIGRLERQKRFDIFLQAARLINNRVANVGFLVVGDGSDRKELESLATELGLSPSVRFTGPRSDVPTLLGISDVFLLTSDFEGLPLTVLEALAMQLPVVATDVDGTSEVLGGGVGGILVPPKDPAATADAVLSLLHDEERRREMGQQGRQLVEQIYSIRVVSEQIGVVYRTILQQNNHSLQTHASVSL